MPRLPSRHAQDESLRDFIHWERVEDLGLDDLVKAFAVRCPDSCGLLILDTWARWDYDRPRVEAGLRGPVYPSHAGYLQGGPNRA